MPSQNQSRPLHEIASEITDKWPTVKYSAQPYLKAMRDLVWITDSYGFDSADSVVRYFLSNATGWRGEDAKRIKAELKAML